MKVCRGEWSCSSTYSSPRRYIEVNGQPHVTAALFPDKERRHPINRRPIGAPESVSKFWRKEKFNAPSGDRSRIIPRFSSLQPSHYIDWAISAPFIGKMCQKTVKLMFETLISEFDRNDWRKLQEISFTSAGISARIRTRHFPCSSEKLCRFSQRVRYIVSLPWTPQCESGFSFPATSVVCPRQDSSI